MSLLHLLNDGRRPGDLFITAWNGGRSLALDISVTSPVAGSWIREAARSAGYAANLRSEQKMRKYQDIRDFDFLPLVVETFGKWSLESIRFVSRLSKQISSQTGKFGSLEGTYLLQRLSVALQRCNASIMIIRA